MSSLDWDGIKGQVYECPRCGYQIKGEELIMRDRIACPNCSYHVIRKIRGPLVKRLKAT